MNIINELEKKLNALKEFQKDFYSFMQSIIQENESLIIDFNVEDQLYEKGINTLGVDISDYAPYSEITIEEKKIKGQPYNRVTLRDEGDFHKSVSLKVTREGFELIASDFKTEDLVKKYGKILGLTEDNLNELIVEYVQPDMYNILKKLLQL